MMLSEADQLLPIRSACASNSIPACGKSAERQILNDNADGGIGGLEALQKISDLPVWGACPAPVNRTQWFQSDKHDGFTTSPPPNPPTANKKKFFIKNVQQMVIGLQKQRRDDRTPSSKLRGASVASVRSMPLLLRSLCALNNAADEQDPLLVRRKAPHNQRIEQHPSGAAHPQS